MRRHIKLRVSCPITYLALHTGSHTMDLRVGNRFKIGKKIGGGSFGDIYQGVNVQSGEPVAIKLEPASTRHPQLLCESRLYRVCIVMVVRLFEQKVRWEKKTQKQTNRF